MCFSPIHIACICFICYLSFASKKTARTRTRRQNAADVWLRTVRRLTGATPINNAQQQAGAQQPPLHSRLSARSITPSPRQNCWLQFGKSAAAGSSTLWRRIAPRGRRLKRRRNISRNNRIRLAERRASPRLPPLCTSSPHLSLTCTCCKQR